MTPLEHALEAYFGPRIRRVDCRPSTYQSSFFVEEIDVCLDDGTTVELLAKAAHWDAKSPEAHLAKPAFLWDARRELTTYESILAQVDLNSPRYFGSYVDDADVRYLLLERIPGIRLWECTDFEPWREAARWLARMHSRVSLEAARTTRAAEHLLRYDREFYESWLHRARQFQQPSADFTMLAQRHPHVVERLLDQPTTFIHGEFYSANILVDDRSAPLAVRPVDWEMAALGPALVDLAYLLAGRWSDDERADVADAYCRELAAQELEIPPRAHCLETLDCCLIQLSVQNLGWSDTWTPPPDHAHDWLGEALRLCEKWRL
jgi:aminoglycoside phosphotransferase (APT) family kinase protein